MSENQVRLAKEIASTLSIKGQSHVSQLIGKSKQAVSEKFKGDQGFTIEQLAILFDALNIAIVSLDEHEVISKAEYAALVTHSKSAIDAKFRAIGQGDRRKKEEVTA